MSVKLEASIGLTFCRRCIVACYNTLVLCGLVEKTMQLSVNHNLVGPILWPTIVDERSNLRGPIFYSGGIIQNPPNISLK